MAGLFKVPFAARHRTIKWKIAFFGSNKFYSVFLFDEHSFINAKGLYGKSVVIRVFVNQIDFNRIAGFDCNQCWIPFIFIRRYIDFHHIAGWLNWSDFRSAKINIVYYADANQNDGENGNNNEFIHVSLFSEK